MGSSVATAAVIDSEMLAERVLKDTFGYQQFRPGQRAIVEAAIAGRDCLVVMPTGEESPCVIRSRRWYVMG